jgi:hypothetical protein
MLGSLRFLRIDYTPITDLSPLASLSGLEWLSIGIAEPLLDLAPLAGLAALRELWITESAPGLDITPLLGQRVTVHIPRDLNIVGVSGTRRARITRY